MSSGSNHWDESAEDYFRHVQRFSTHRRITTLLAANCETKPSKIIDFGCGPGNSTAVLSQLFPEATAIIGIDSSQAMLDIAVSQNPASRVSYLLASSDLSQLSGASPFDAVFFSNSFFHVEDKKTLLRTIAPLLTDEGRLYFSMYESVFHPKQFVWPYSNRTADKLMDDMIKELQARGISYEHRQEDREVFSEASLLALFRETGFSLRLGAVIALERKKQERLSFLKIPAVSEEVFPGVARDIVNESLDSMSHFRYAPQTRNVFVFSAQLASNGAFGADATT